MEKNNKFCDLSNLGQLVNPTFYLVEKYNQIHKRNINGSNINVQGTNLPDGSTVVTHTWDEENIEQLEKIDENTIDRDENEDKLEVDNDASNNNETISMNIPDGDIIRNGDNLLSEELMEEFVEKMIITRFTL